MEKMPSGKFSSASGAMNPSYGMKTLVQMIMMGTFTGGACWPAMEAIARMAATGMRGIPIFIRMG